MPHPLRRLLSLDRRGWRDLFRAQAAILRAQWRLRREPIGTLVRRGALVGPPPAGEPARALDVARSVERVSAHGLFRPYCLVQALAIRELLEREGILGATIRVGVRRAAGALEAHAWVRWGSYVLGDRAEHVAQFTEVDDLSVLPRR